MDSHQTTLILTEDSLRTLPSTFSLNSSKLFQKAFEMNKSHFYNMLSHPLKPSKFVVPKQYELLSELVQNNPLNTESVDSKNEQTNKNKNKRKDLDKEEKKLAKVHKKRRTRTSIERKESTSTTFTTESRENSDADAFDQEVNTQGKKITKRESNAIDKLKSLSAKKTCTSMNLFYGKNKEIMFKFEYYLSGESQQKSIVFTREQILQHDPRWILYFYENHLEFSEFPDFQPEMLRRI